MWQGACQRRHRHDRSKCHRRRRLPDRRVCATHASPLPHRDGTGSALSGDAEAGTFAARGQFQASRGVQPAAVGGPAGGRSDCGVGRQSRRGGGVCRAGAGCDGGDLRSRADTGREGGPHRELWRSRGADRCDVCRRFGGVAGPAGADWGAGSACLRSPGRARRAGHRRAGVRAGRTGPDAYSGRHRRRRADRRDRGLVCRKCHGDQR